MAKTKENNFTLDYYCPNSELGEQYECEECPMKNTCDVYKEVSGV
jgi:hypothetical protein